MHEGNIPDLNACQFNMRVNPQAQMGEVTYGDQASHK